MGSPVFGAGPLTELNLWDVQVNPFQGYESYVWPNTTGSTVYVKQAESFTSGAQITWEVDTSNGSRLGYGGPDITRSYQPDYFEIDPGNTLTLWVRGGSGPGQTAFYFWIWYTTTP